MNPKELIAVFGKGCKNCEYKYDCPDAFTELSHYCGAYREDQKEENDERANFNVKARASLDSDRTRRQGI